MKIRVSKLVFINQGRRSLRNVIFPRGKLSVSLWSKRKSMASFRMNSKRAKQVSSGVISIRSKCGDLS